MRFGYVMPAFTDIMARYKQARKYVEPFLNLAVEREVFFPERVPKNGPAIVIANHRSDMDPFIVAAAINRYIVWMAASYDFKIPVLGQFLKELGMIPISDEKKDQINAFKEVSKSIRSDRMVGIFPEGDSYITNNDFSVPLGEFHPGFARFAVRLQAPVLPVTIIGVRENVEPWPVPKFLREFLGLPKHVLEVKNRLALKKVKVIIGELIDIQPFLKMNADTAVEMLIRESRERMMENIRKYGEVERRQEKQRQSGTRVLPENQS